MTDQAPLVSIVLPCYNYGHLVGGAIESIASQYDERLEIIVINDGSTDDSLSVLQQLQSEYSWLRVEDQHNQGLSATRNRGIEISTGEYLVFLDSDDSLAEGCIATLLSAIKASSADIYVFGKMNKKEGSDVLTYKAPPSLSSNSSANFLRYIDGDISLSNGSVVIKRACFEERGLRYNTSLVQNEDLPVFATLLANYQAETIQDPFLVLFSHDGSMRTDLNRLSKLRVEDVVNELFQPNYLPSYLLKYRGRFFANRLIRRFDRYYKAKHFTEAKACYLQAFQQSFFHAVFNEKIFRFLSCLLKAKS